MSNGENFHTFGSSSFGAFNPSHDVTLIVLLGSARLPLFSLRSNASLDASDLIASCRVAGGQGRRNPLVLCDLQLAGQEPRSNWPTTATTTTALVYQL